MTKSILNDCLLLKDKPIEELQSYFKAIGCTIFDTILSMKAIEGRETILEFEPKNTVLFILAAFSEDSPLVIIRQDDTSNKTAICDYLGIPECFRHNLINLIDKEVRKAAVDYMQQFCGTEFFCYMKMKIQFNDFDRDVTNREFTAKNDEVVYYDWKEHGKATMEMQKLAKSIAKMETELRNQNKRYDGIEEMRDWRASGGKKRASGGNGARSLRIEANPLLTGNENGDN